MAVNQIFFIGSNKYGQAGTGEKDNIKIYEIPRSYDFGVFVKQVSCGYHHSAILTSDGHVYMMGSNIHGTLATKEEGLNYSFSPILVENLSSISKVESGAFHLCALSNEGKIYSWGRGMDGQLGTGLNKNSSTPELINMGEEIINVSCGTNHSLVLGQSGSAYAFGNGIYGQLGTGNNKNQSKPVKINLNNVNMVAAGDNHSLFLCTGTIFSTGDNTSGQTGTGNMKKYVLQPQAIQLQNVSIIQASKFSAAIADGQLYIWGYKSHKFKPYLVQSDEELNEMKCGNQVVMALTAKGDLYNWKINDQQPQLSQIKIDTQAILGFSVGESHSLIIGDIIRSIQQPQTAPKVLKHYSSSQKPIICKSKSEESESFRETGNDRKQKFLSYLNKASNSNFTVGSSTHNFNKVDTNKENNHMKANYEQEDELKHYVASFSSEGESESSMVESNESVLDYLLNCHKSFEEVKRLLEKSNKIGNDSLKHEYSLGKENISNNIVSKEKKGVMILRQKDLMISQLQDEISKKQAIIIGYQKTMQTLTKLLCIQKLYTDEKEKVN